MLKRLVLALALMVAGCKQETPPAPGESCSLNDDGRVVDVAGRPDGIYGLTSDVVPNAPLASVASVKKTGEGVEPSSHKRWIGLHLSDEGARAIKDFTKDPAGKRMAVIAGGKLASVHKVREPIVSADMQVSCCDPTACDRWSALLAK